MWIHGGGWPQNAYKRFIGCLPLFVDVIGLYEKCMQLVKRHIHFEAGPLFPEVNNPHTFLQCRGSGVRKREKEGKKGVNLLCC